MTGQVRRRSHDSLRKAAVGLTAAAVTVLVTLGTSPLARATEAPEVNASSSDAGAAGATDDLTSADATAADGTAVDSADPTGPASDEPGGRTDPGSASTPDPAQEARPPAPAHTSTPEPSHTAKPTHTPKPTHTAKPTHTPKPTHTAKPTHTPKPTHSPTSTPPPPQPATLEVAKEWVVNGAAAVPDGEQLDGLEAALLLDGETAPWGTAQEGYARGDTVTISETTRVVGLELCEITGTSIRGGTLHGSTPLADGVDVTLAKGANVLTVTNEVECTSRLQLVKAVNDDSDVNGWTLSARGGDNAMAFPGGTSGVEAEVTPEERYLLAEGGGDPRYVPFVHEDAAEGTTASWTCQRLDAEGNTIPGYSDGRDGLVTVHTGHRVQCAALNQAATLRLVKTVDNGGGGIQQPDHWTLHTEPVDAVDGIDTVSTPGSAAGFAVTVRPETDYYIWETAPPTLGYDLIGPTCSSANGPVAVRPAANGRFIVSVPVDTVVSCTFLNDDGPAVWRTAKTSNPPSGTEVARGDVITYTVTASYVSGVEARNIVVTDDLSGLLPHATIVSGPSVTAGEVVLDGSTLRWTLPTLTSTETLTFSVRVTAAGSVSIVNAIVPSTEGPCDPCRTVHTTRVAAPVAADPADPRPARLATTGASSQPLVALGLGVLTLGATLLEVRRRRVHRS